MSQELLTVLTIGGTLLLVLTGLLNFSVFVRQLRASRAQLETAKRQLENSRQGPEILLVQRAMSETSDHVKVLIQKPYLRPYFYENREWVEGDVATSDEVKAMAELMLNNFASAIIHSAAFPQYPVRSVEQTIRAHLRTSPAMRAFLIEEFERFQLAGLPLLCLKNDNKIDTQADLSRLIASATDDPRERQRRENLLSYVKNIADDVDALDMAKYSLESGGVLIH